MLDLITETYGDEEFLIADDFDDAIIGVDENSMRIIYSQKKILEILVTEGMDYEDAFEHYGYNIIGGYVGEKTPIFCADDFE